MLTIEEVRGQCHFVGMGIEKIVAAINDAMKRIARQMSGLLVCVCVVQHVDANWNWAYYNLNQARVELDSARETLNQAQLNEDAGITIENGWATSTPPLDQAWGMYQSALNSYEAAKVTYDIQRQVDELRRQEEEKARQREHEEEQRRIAPLQVYPSPWGDSQNENHNVANPQRLTAEEIRAMQLAEYERKKREEAEQKAREEYERTRPSEIHMTFIVPNLEERAPMPGSRIWTDRHGKQFSAKWVQVSSDYTIYVLVSDKTGKRVNAIYGKFSDQDQKYLEEEVNKYLSAGYVVHDGWWYKTVVASKADHVKNGGFRTKHLDIDEE